MLWMAACFVSRYGALVWVARLCIHLCALCQFLLCQYVHCSTNSGASGLHPGLFYRQLRADLCPLHMWAHML